MLDWIEVNQEVGPLDFEKNNAKVVLGIYVFFLLTKGIYVFVVRKSLLER